MLKRKIIENLVHWKERGDKLPLVLHGQRQVGKTTAVMEFAREHYKSVFALNFLERPELVSVFEGDLGPDAVLRRLSVAFPSVRRVDGSTLIFLDEVQHCPNGRTALKFLAKDVRFDVIASGSLLGLNHNDERSFPVGYVETMQLCPLDFEEFLWANGIGEDVIDYLHSCFDERKPVDRIIHDTMLGYFTSYMIIGGMPAVVASYVEGKDYSVALEIQREIVKGYRNDVVKYAQEPEKAKILRTFDSITTQLSKDYKKFQYAIIDKGARSRSHGGSLLWLKDAGIVTFCNNLSTIQLPLAAFSIDDEFKVYMADTGLLVSMYEDGTAFSLQRGELGLFKGAFYENIIAQCLSSQGMPLFYFSPSSSSSLEIDFVINYHHEPCLIEVKSGENKKSKSLDTVLRSGKYGVKRAIRFSRNNVGESGQIISLPLYMVMFVKNEDDSLPELPSGAELSRLIPVKG